MGKVFFLTEMVMCMKRLDNRKGQTLVEFALVLPILLLLLLGIFEFGRIFNATLVLEHAVRDAARVGAVSHSETEIEEIIESQYLKGITHELVFDVEDEDHKWDAGNRLTIRAKYDIDVITPIISVFVGNTISLESEASMRIE